MLNFFKEIIVSNLQQIGITGLTAFLGYLIIKIIRSTKTLKDDVILDNYLKKGIDFALSVMPEKTTINSVKLTKNILESFISEYTRETKECPNENVYKQVFKRATEIAIANTNKSKLDFIIKK